MKNAFLSLLWLGALVAAFASPLNETQIQPVMQQKVDTILGILNDENLTLAQRNHAIEMEMDPYFDFELMAKLSLGKKAWVSATPAQRQEYVTLFERRIKDSYMSKLDLYKNETITLETPKKVKNRIHLNSYIVQKGAKKEVLYKFYRTKKRGWLIYDVDVLGVSIIQTYRSQFASELANGSMEALLEKMRKPIG